MKRTGYYPYRPAFPYVEVRFSWVKAASTKAEYATNTPIRSDATSLAAFDIRFPRHRISVCFCVFARRLENCSGLMRIQSFDGNDPGAETWNYPYSRYFRRGEPMSLL